VSRVALFVAKLHRRRVRYEWFVIRQTNGLGLVDLARTVVAPRAQLRPAGSRGRTPPVKGVGERRAGELHARFDRRELETQRRGDDEPTTCGGVPAGLRNPQHRRNHRHRASARAYLDRCGVWRYAKIVFDVYDQPAVPPLVASSPSRLAVCPLTPSEGTTIAGTAGADVSIVASARNCVVVSTGNQSVGRPESGVLDRTSCEMSALTCLAYFRVWGRRDLSENVAHEEIAGTQFGGRLVEEIEVGRGLCSVSYGHLPGLDLWGRGLSAGRRQTLPGQLHGRGSVEGLVDGWDWPL